MKVNARTETISIARSQSLQKALGNIQKGGRIGVRILERHDRHFATLEVRGKHLVAEFLKGVPGSNRLTLILEERNREVLVFRMENPSMGQGLSQDLKDALIGLDKGNGANLLKSLASHTGISGLFELNTLLLDPQQRDQKRGRGLALIFNQLLKAGLSPESLLTLSTILANRYFPGLLFFTDLLGDKKRKDQEKTFSEENIEAVIDEIDEVVSKSGDNGRSLLQSIPLILELMASEGDICTGELPLFEDGTFQPLHFIRAGNSWICSFTLSQLGTIELLAREGEGERSITIFGETPEAVEVLAEEQENLRKKLPNVAILIKNRRDLLNKLIEINSHYSLNSQLDIKV